MATRGILIIREKYLSVGYHKNGERAARSKCLEIRSDGREGIGRVIHVNGYFEDANRWKGLKGCPYLVNDSYISPRRYRIVESSEETDNDVDAQHFKALTDNAIASNSLVGNHSNEESKEHYTE